jgi:predicted DNA-binding protein
MKEARITIRISEQEQLLLSGLSQRKNKTESEIVREALGKYLKEAMAEQNCYDLAMELGIIGVASGQPSDLSTNKDYLNRFGE